MLDQTMLDQTRHAIYACAIIVAVMAVAGCDAVAPQSEPVLVVEAFAETNAALPSVRIRQTLRMDAPYDEAAAVAEGAEVTLILPDGPVSYAPIAATPGRYAPQSSQTLPAETPFTLDVRWGEQHATAEGRLPPRIEIVNVRANPSEEPVEAVLLDSLQIDSLQTGARSAFVYPVEVTLQWAPSTGTAAADSVHWIRAQLKPFTEGVPGVIELFFRSEQIVREDRVRVENGLRTWTGVYLVPVDSASEPLPEHSLKVALLRSDDDYARFASSRNAPERREPVGNVVGGIGIVAAVSVDSLTVRIR